MRELRTSGSVGGRPGNRPAYPTGGLLKLAIRQQHLEKGGNSMHHRARIEIDHQHPRDDQPHAEERRPVQPLAIDHHPQ